MKTHYFITGFAKSGDAFYDGDCRTFGYVEELDEAKRIVENNVLDINEGGYYQTVVIESINPGIYSYDGRERIFYKWDTSEKKYKEFVPNDNSLHIYGNLCGVG